MKISLVYIVLVLCISCSQMDDKSAEIIGTWELQTGVIVKDKDTIRTDYTKGQRFLKIINETHFSFLRHDLNKGKDSVQVFVAGGGNYSFDGKTYKEELEFCTGRSWEGKNFNFEVIIKKDTLVQMGLEKNEELGIEQEIVETYIRVKN